MGILLPKPSFFQKIFTTLPIIRPHLIYRRTFRIPVPVFDSHSFAPEVQRTLRLNHKEDMQERLSDLKAVQEELNTTNLLIRNTGQYLANKSVYQEYLKLKNKNQFCQEHEPQLLLYEAARKELRHLSNGEKILSLKHLKERKAELISRKNARYEDYSFFKGKLRELQTIESNVKSILETGRELGIAQSNEHSR